MRYHAQPKSEPHPGRLIKRRAGTAARRLVTRRAVRAADQARSGAGAPARVAGGGHRVKGRCAGGLSEQLIRHGAAPGGPRECRGGRHVRGGHRGATTITRCPRAASAMGSEPTTSPRPPVLLQGATSADTNTMSSGRSACCTPAARSPPCGCRCGPPAACARRRAQPQPRPRSLGPSTLCSEHDSIEAQRRPLSRAQRLLQQLHLSQPLSTP